MKLYTPQPPQLTQKEYKTQLPTLLATQPSDWPDWLKTAQNYLNFADFSSEYAEKIDVNEAWKWIRAYRLMRSQNTPLSHPNGDPFTLYYDPEILRKCHQFDHTYSPQLNQPDTAFHSLKHNQMITEACASCSLAGFEVNEQRAKTIIWGGAKAHTEAEKLVKSYHTILTQLNEFDYGLNLESIKSVHQQLLNPLYKAKASTLRTDSDPNMWTNTDNTIFYGLPPSPLEAIKEMDICCQALSETDAFYHPLIEAALILFAFQVNRPFRYHNELAGRLWAYARINQHDYPHPLGISLSAWIQTHTQKWDTAMGHSLFDAADITHFIHMFLSAITESSALTLALYQQHKRQNRQLSKEKRNEYQLNKRQVNTLLYLIEHKNNRITPTIYMNHHGISWATAVNDLKRLDNQLLLTSLKEGKHTFYYANQFSSALFNEHSTQDTIQR